MGTQLVAVGDYGTILTSSQLIFTPPYSPDGRKIRAAIYTLTSGRIVEIRTGADREIKIPIGNLRRGPYVFEWSGAGMRIAEPFAITP